MEIYKIQSLIFLLVPMLCFSHLKNHYFTNEDS